MPASCGPGQADVGQARPGQLDVGRGGPAEVTTHLDTVPAGLVGEDGIDELVQRRTRDGGL